MVNIRVLGENSYEIGKAFENLCIIVLGELGYCDFIPNVRKPGMEIDFTCKSKLLDQKLIAECKAKEELVSSSDYNVFYGKFTRERSRNDKYLNGVLLTISDFNSEVKESYESENEDIKHFLKLMNNKDIIKLLEESSLIKSLIIREIVDKYSGGEVIDESILFVQNKLYWSSKIELSEGKKAIIILNGNGEYLKDYEVDGIKNELQKLEIYKNIAIINPMIEDKIIMALLEIAMTKKEISNAVKESSLSVDNAVRKMIMDNIVEENTGKIELSRKTDSFVDVCNRILDSSNFNKFLQSSYCAKCLDEAIIRKISSRFYIDFETSEFEALLRILRVSKSALLFSLFGDTSKFLVSHEHVKEHCINGEQKKANRRA